MLRGDARKRLDPPAPHHDPAVCALIEQARDEGRVEGWRMAQMAMESERRAAGMYQ